MGISNEIEVVNDEVYSDEEVEECPEELKEVMKQIEDYTPTIPDALTLSYFKKAGFSEIDPRIVRLASISAQKFISDIANDALQHCKTRTNNNQHSNANAANKDKKLHKDRKYVLAVEDLTPALADHGIIVRKPQYYV